MALTRNYGFNYFGGNTPGGLDEDGGKFTGADRIAIDRMLRALAATTRHQDTGTDFTDPAAPTASVSTGGGLPGGVTYGYCVTLVDADGMESLPSAEVVVSTPDVLIEPEEPLVESTDGALEAGLYYYALTAIRDVEESPQGAQTSITLDVDGGVLLTMPAPPPGAIKFQIWRMNVADVGWTRIALVDATEALEYTDAGSVPANTDADDPGQQPPLTNLGVSIYRVQIELHPDDVAIATAPGSRVAAWNVYRTETPSAYPAASLVHHVVDRDDPLDTGDPDLPLITTFSDGGDVLLDGVPPLASTQMDIAPYVFDASPEGWWPDPTQYPEHYPIIIGDQLYARIGPEWVKLSDTSLDWKQSARVLATTDVNIAAAPAAIDGVTLFGGDRVLLVAQTTPAANGIYVFAGAGDPMTRAADANTSAKVTDGLSVFIEQGSVGVRNTIWALITDDVELEVTDLTFTQVGLVYTGTSPIIVTGNTISLDTVPVTLGGTGATAAPAARTNLGAAQKGFSADVGALTAATPLAIPHGLGVHNLVVNVWETATGDLVRIDTRVDDTNITLTSPVAVPAAALRVTAGTAV